MTGFIRGELQEGLKRPHRRERYSAQGGGFAEAWVLMLNVDRSEGAEETRARPQLIVFSQILPGFYSAFELIPSLLQSYALLVAGTPGSAKPPPWVCVGFTAKAAKFLYAFRLRQPIAAVSLHRERLRRTGRRFRRFGFPVLTNRNRYLLY
jgi:hypothetical protein